MAAGSRAGVHTKGSGALPAGLETPCVLDLGLSFLPVLPVLLESSSMVCLAAATATGLAGAGGEQAGDGGSDMLVFVVPNAKHSRSV